MQIANHRSAAWIITDPPFHLIRWALRSSVQERAGLIALLTNCKYTYFMILELLKHPDYLRILLALKRRPLRFTEIQKSLDLNPVQVDRALRSLRKGFWIVARTVPAKKGKISVQYILGARGAAFLESFESFRTEAERRQKEIGKSEVAELQSLSR